MDTTITSIPARTLTTDFIGVQVYVRDYDVWGILSDFDGLVLFVGGQILSVKPDTGIVF